ERLVRLGVIADYTRIWWDLRPHPTLGTLEIRMPDQPTDVRRSAALAGLLQRLAGELLRETGVRQAGRGGHEPEPWTGRRLRPRAELIAPDGERMVPAFELFGPEWEHGEGELQARFDDPLGATADLVERSV